MLEGKEDRIKKCLKDMDSCNKPKFELHLKHTLWGS